MRTSIKLAEAQHLEQRCRPPQTLRNVTLLIHCRSSRDICQSRQPLLQAYAAYFKEVRWLLKWPTDTDALPPSSFRCQDPGDPYACLVPVLRASAGSAGLLYMHFDAVVSPCVFGDGFDAAKVGTFSVAKQLMWRSYASLDKCNFLHEACWWSWWDFDGSHAKRWKLLDSVVELQRAALEPGFPANASAASTLYDQLRTGVYWGMDDFFYLPRGAFRLYAAQAPLFAKHGVFHEMAGPSLLHLTRVLANLELQDFGCAGDCCNQVQAAELASPSFRCGHPVYYPDAQVEAAVAALVNGRRPEVQTSFASVEPRHGPSRRVAPALLLLLALGAAYAIACSQRLTQALSPVVLSYLICAGYICVSVAIDVSISVQSGAGQQPYAFEPLCAVLLAELLKLAVSLCLVLRRWLTEPPATGSEWSAFTLQDAGWFGAVAALFMLNNVLVWLAIGYNDVSTFGIFRDTMILWTAALWRLVFKTPLGWGRLAGIAVVFAGLALKEVGSLVSDKALSLAVLLVLAMTAFNALGSVANEFAMKRRAQLDINIQNSLLYTACAMFAALGLVATGKWRGLVLTGFFHGFTRATFCTVSLQALAGLTVSRLLKYADSVQKTIAACLRGPILVVVAPAFTTSTLDSLTLTSAVVVASGCLLYLREGPLSANLPSKADAKA